jgi:hypothetical protein
MKDKVSHPNKTTGKTIVFFSALCSYTAKGKTKQPFPEFNVPHFFAHEILFFSLLPPHTRNFRTLKGCISFASLLY